MCRSTSRLEELEYPSMCRPVQWVHWNSRWNSLPGKPNWSEWQATQPSPRLCCRWLPPPQTPVLHWAMGQTSSNRKVKMNVIPSFCICSPNSHESNTTCCHFSTCQYQQEPRSVARGAALSLGVLWIFLGQQPFTNFKVLRPDLMQTTCFVTWLSILVTLNGNKPVLVLSM